MKQKSYISILIKRKSNEKMCLMGLTCLSLVISCASCKKKTNETPTNNNEIKATIIRGPGDTLFFNAKGSNVGMGPIQFGVAEAITAINNTNDDLTLTIPGFLQGPGTYNYVCKYHQSIIPIQPIYTNSGANPGSITFTSYSNSYWEGYFTAVCRSPNGDSAVVTGTFKGNHIQM